MNSDFEFIEDKEKNDELMSIYFNFINGKYLERALRFFCKKRGVWTRNSIRSFSV